MSDLSPPQSPMGPDFIIAGAPRCGTTWLYHLLAKHPDVYLASPLQPEPKFFLVDEVYRQGVDFYKKKWFFNAPLNKKCGEKSTNYLESASAARRIHKHFPRVSLIFILREPAARAYSNYLWSKNNGYEQCTFEDALALEESRENNLPNNLKYSRPHAYFSRGLYVTLLEPYFRDFPRENILILKYESIIENPYALAARLYAFLEIPSRVCDVDGLGVINQSVAYDTLVEVEVFVNLRKRYEVFNKKLALLTGTSY